MTLAFDTVEFDRLPPRRARWFVRSVLTRWGLPEVLDDAELLVDELVCNAMRHARGTGVDVTVRSVHDAARVEVSHRDPDFFIDFQRPPDAPPRSALRIADSLARRRRADARPCGPGWRYEPG